MEILVMGYHLNMLKVGYFVLGIGFLYLHPTY